MPRLSSGTGAIHDGLHSMIEDLARSSSTMRQFIAQPNPPSNQLNMSTVVVDFNDPQAIKALIENDNLELCFDTNHPSTLGDSYDLASVIPTPPGASKPEILSIILMTIVRP